MTDKAVVKRIEAEAFEAAFQQVAGEFPQQQWTEEMKPALLALARIYQSEIIERFLTNEERLIAKPHTGGEDQ